jgi:hypothetical protein
VADLAGEIVVLFVFSSELVAEFETQRFFEGCICVFSDLGPIKRGTRQFLSFAF